MKLKVSSSRCTYNVNENGNHYSSVRRVLPQILGAMAKNLMLVNLGEFLGFLALVIPSLTGLSKELNPDETIQISAAQASWLSTFSHVAHPIGSVLSGPINDRFGRRKTIMFVNIPLTICWIILGFSHSYPIICLMFIILGFSFGLKEAPSVTYVAEICEPSVRGTMSSISSISSAVGTFIALAFGSVFPWRKVAFICALFPIACIIAVTFIPESPSWLLSRGRVADAQKSLQWLRGWTTPQAVHKEFDELQNYAITSKACAACAKQSIECCHAKPTILDKIKEIKRQRNVRPILLIFLLQFFGIFNGSRAWEAYIVQVVNAFGTPIKPNLASVLISAVGIVGSLFLMLTVKKIGRRSIYLTTSAVLAVCCFGLSVYGFTFLPRGWTSFKKDPNESAKDPELLGKMVGNFNYIALGLVLVSRFCGKAGTDTMPFMFVSEVYPLKLRSFLCGISLANAFVLTSIATKTYYDVEMWLSLPGTFLFYGLNSVIGFIVMYKIMPETEKRALEDIELHYSDKTKRLTDIHIARKQQQKQ